MYPHIRVMIAIGDVISEGDDIGVVSIHSLDNVDVVGSG